MTNEQFLTELQEITKRLDVDVIYTYNEGQTFNEFEDNIFDLITQEEIIYYHTAIEYLQDNDPSLTESCGLASEMGCEVHNLNSELLATILHQQKLSEEWYGISEEVEELFELRDEETEEDKQ